ncbi:hypothetical protein HKCCE4037_02005 [Rhodobacterales bacterium HKCCE4037]|nr:hypothetical protein [Rhodobacterales bacterium HKCCE4037]
MPKYLFIYHGGGDMSGPPPPEEQEAAMAAWGAWMDKIGPAIVDAGEPVGKSMKVGSDGVSDKVENPAYGWTIVQADTMEAACALAEGNPMIADGGHVEVAEIMPIQM